VRFVGEDEVKASRESLWKFLNTPEQVSKCIPDVQTLEVIDKNNFNAVIKVGIGFVKTKFNFKFTLANIDAPKHEELKATGSGSGSIIDFSAVMDLVEIDKARTKLKWSADAQLLGPLAAMASRFMQSAATDITKKLFACVKRAVEETSN